MSKSTIFGIILILIIVTLGLFSTMFKAQTGTINTIDPNSNYLSDKSFFEELGGECAGQGETYDFTDGLDPNECCEGLENVLSTDSISIDDTCYWTGTESGSPMETCSNCGNGICEDVESVCGCPEDCTNKGLSAYSLEEFCLEYNGLQGKPGQIAEQCLNEYFAEESICNLCN